MEAALTVAASVLPPPVTAAVLRGVRTWVSLPSAVRGAGGRTAQLAALWLLSAPLHAAAQRLAMRLLLRACAGHRECGSGAGGGGAAAVGRASSPCERNRLVRHTTPFLKAAVKTAVRLALAVVAVSRLGMDSKSLLQVGVGVWVRVWHVACVCRCC